MCSAVLAYTELQKDVQWYARSRKSMHYATSSQLPLVLCFRQESRGNTTYHEYSSEIVDEAFTFNTDRVSLSRYVLCRVQTINLSSNLSPESTRYKWIARLKRFRVAKDKRTVKRNYTKKVSQTKIFKSQLFN